jgi:hypothetical protein
MTPRLQDHIDAARLLLELDGYGYPMEYRWLRLHGFRGFTPWRCIDDIDEATTIRKEFLLEVGGGSIPVRDFLPFARSEPADDFAGFIQSKGEVTGEICVAHLTFRGSAEVSDYPTHDVYPSLWEWLERVLADTREFCQPRAVVDLEASLQRQDARGR